MPFGTSESQTVHCFELIHIDVWGPCRESSLTNSSYFLTIVDDCSRATWVFLMQQKSEVTHILRNFFLLIERQFDKRVKRIRSDNGLEFLGQDCQRLFNSEGIFHERSCVYTPQQNGVVERKHQHLLDMARAILFHAGLSVRL